MTIDTFKAIVKNKNIRLTDIQTSNDASELRLVYGVLRDVFIEEFEREKPKYINEYFPIDEFEEFYKKHTHYIDEIENVIHTQYTTCFSSEGDMLSQWRGYGDDGRGVSVGFDISVFNVDEHYNFGKVEYSLRKQKSLFRKDVKEIIKNIRRYVKENKSIEGYSSKDFMTSYNILLLKGVYVKNPFFHEEKEWRYSFWYSKAKDFEEVKLPNNAIKEVIIGPKCQISKEEIDKMLKESSFTGYEITYSAGHGIYVDSQNQKKYDREGAEID